MCSHSGARVVQGDGLSHDGLDVLEVVEGFSEVKVEVVQAGQHAVEAPDCQQGTTDAVQDLGPHYSTRHHGAARTRGVSHSRVLPVCRSSPVRASSPYSA